MGAWVKLTTRDKGPVYVNLARATHVEKFTDLMGKPTGSRVVFRQAPYPSVEGDECVYVEESPEAILSAAGVLNA